MRSTGIEYSSADRTPVVLPEMTQLLSPLTGEQLATLEADLLANCCYYNTRRVQRSLGVLTPMEKHDLFLAA